MRRADAWVTAISLGFAALCVWLGQEGIAPRAAAQTSQDRQTQTIVSATNAFLNSLTAAQRAKVQFSFPGGEAPAAAQFKGGRGGQMTFVGERYGDAVWSNFPVSDVPRPGLQLGSMTETQRTAAMQVLKVLLSAKGIQKVAEIMGSDQALSDGGTAFAAGNAVYTIGIFGTPSITAPWMVEYGGHHLALNIKIAGAEGVLTPALTGAQPSVYTSNGKSIRVLAAENDKAFALLYALDEGQRKKAILGYHIGDLVLGPGHGSQAIQPEGLKGSEMNEHQRAMILDLIGEWAGIVNDAYASSRMAELKTELNETWFAWSGPTTHAPGKNGTAYYRIQGPRVVIEFSPQDTNGDPAMHVHTIYRNPADDYGRALAGK